MQRYSFLMEMISPKGKTSGKRQPETNEEQAHFVRKWAVEFWSHTQNLQVINILLEGDSYQEQNVALKCRKSNETKR